MLSSILLRRLVSSRQAFSITVRSQSKLNIEKIEAESNTDDLEAIDEEAQLREEQLQKSRNKSRLAPPHRNVVNGQPAYSEPKHWSHVTLRYQRKVYGKYGDASNFNPSLCWHKEEIANKSEYESIAYPYTIQQLIEMSEAKRQQKIATIEKRQQDIDEKMKKVDTWKEELKRKIAKKDAEALAAKERKDKLIEEVRRHFGFTVDPRDDRFKEMLEKKEKEQKKAMKEAKKKAKEEMMIEKLAGKAKSSDTQTTNNEPKDN